MNPNTKLDIQGPLHYLKTFGVSGRISDPEAQRRDPRYAAMVDGDDMLAAKTAYFTALASATPQTDAEKARTLQLAWEESCRYDGQKALWGDTQGVAKNSIRHALAAARIEYINNWVVARPNFRSLYFDVTSLAMDEQPFIVNETENEISITWMSEDGSPERNRFVKPQSRTPVALSFKSTKIARVKTLDLYRGNVADRINSTLNLARDMDINLDLTYFGMLNAPLASGGAFGVFSYENGRTADNLKLWRAHSAIDQTQLPTTNDYDLTASPRTTNNPSPVGNFTSLGINIVTAIQDYCNRFGDLFGGPIVWNGDIIVPAYDISDIAVAWLATANVAEQKIQQDLNSGGYRSFNYQGQNVKLIPSLFITRGTCYPVFNRKPGVAFEKPSLDRELVTVNMEQNYEDRQLRKVIGGVVIAQRRPYVMRIKYSTASNSSSTDDFKTFLSANMGVVGGTQTESEAIPTIS